MPLRGCLFRHGCHPYLLSDVNILYTPPDIVDAVTPITTSFYARFDIVVYADCFSAPRMPLRATYYATILLDARR